MQMSSKRAIVVAVIALFVFFSGVFLISGKALSNPFAFLASAACTAGACPNATTLTGVRTFTSGVNQTYTTPPDTAYVVVEVWGGGGGGGGANSVKSTRGTGGGGGGYAQKTIFNPQASYTYSIGEGGVGGATSESPTSGANGGTSSFGSVLAEGGRGGSASVGSANAGVPGGSASGGDINITGGYSFTLNDASYAGWGGDAARGGAGCKVNVSSPGNAPGGGGCASNYTPGASGGAGAPGMIVVHEYSNVSNSSSTTVQPPVQPSGNQRIVPSGDTTFYVAPPTNCSNGYWADTGTPVTTCGSDTTGNGTRGAPFATPQKAHDTFAAQYDFQCKYRPTIQLGTPSSGQWYYPGLLVSGRLVGQCGAVAPLIYGNPPQTLLIGKYLPYTLRGDPSHPTRAMLWPGHGNFPNTPCLSLSNAAMVADGFTCTTIGINQDCMDAFDGSLLEVKNLWFGHCGDPLNATNPTNFLVFGIAWYSSLIPTGPITLTGGGASFMQVAQSVVLPNVDGGSAVMPVTIINNPTFTQGFFVIDGGTVYADKFSFSGTIQGRKALVVRNGVLSTGTGDEGPHSCFTKPGTSNFIPGTWNAATMIEDNAVCR